jgi:hypothetical protein
VAFDDRRGGEHPLHVHAPLAGDHPEIVQVVVVQPFHGEEYPITYLNRIGRNFVIVEVFGGGYSLARKEASPCR